MEGYRIETADSEIKYEGLRSLWCRVFGDAPEYVDGFYRAFGNDIEGYVICGEDGNVVSALTCYKAGRMHMPMNGGENDPEDSNAELDGMPVYVSYAICTDPEYRGQGLAAALTGYVRDMVTQEYGGISLVSPAEESLIRYYAALGYREGFFAAEEYLVRNRGENLADLIDEDEDFTAFEPGMSVEPVSGEDYNILREAFLADIPHVALSARMLEFIRMDSEGGNGLLVVNGGDALCRLSYISENACNDADCVRGRQIMLDELLINPMLSELSEEIDGEIAVRIAEHFGADNILFRKPGHAKCQSMYAALSGGAVSGYFGFPID